MMKHGAAFLLLSLTWPTGLSAQPAATQTEAAGEQLARGLFHEKVDGRADSAAFHYRRVLDLHAAGRATPVVARMARARLARLGFDQDLTGPDSTAVPRRAPDEVATVRSLPWTLTQTTVSAGSEADPLRHRQRWFARVLQLSPRRATSRLQPGWMTGLGRGIDALRASLGLRGIVYYVAMEKRRARGRPLTPHERLLVALWSEKEQQHFGIAEGTYRELVQLDSTGGIATRLTDRARQGVARTQRWRHTDPGTAALVAESE